MYIKKILLVIVGLGVIGGGMFAYKVYTAIFSPNTRFEAPEQVVFIPSDADFDQVRDSLRPLLTDMISFEQLATRKGYAANIKAGKYVIAKGMNNNQIINSLRSNNIPVRVSFNNQERVENLAGRIAAQIEADSVSLVKAMKDPDFLAANDLTEPTQLAIYLPNSYEFFWNTSAEKFRDRMLKEYQRFWTPERVEKAKEQGLTPNEAITLASIVHKETSKIDERPRVAGLYLNRLKKNNALQADPTVIYALKKHQNDFDLVIKRVLYKDLEIDSPYNTYKYAGLPPGPITMPDISAIEAVLDPEEHEYLYMVANVENFGYHKFAKTLAQHNRNKEQYIRWINSQQINR
ncbi:endolytic transglycosylase MltG [Flavobacteriaceae bacterium TP-CH-4]|uniref:Endolytic murein transglycosylase n=1 Tax=Pelagihabitans pacificus TaxID=2696054 RepID=A0A967E5D4_9FLAO|nr:endolytic transglycosylase MltG [Pelagihabitans pacificus]NHF59327.1 endolytic transglycosylase MltG [Pelagihabitans pacificus]